MQGFGSPDESPLQGLVASRIKTYGGRRQASTQSPAGSHYPRGGPILVSSGCALRVTWVGQEGGHPSFEVTVPLQVHRLLYSCPSPSNSSPACGGEEGSTWAKLSVLHTLVLERGRKPGEARLTEEVL